MADLTPTDIAAMQAAGIDPVKIQAATEALRTQGQVVQQTTQYVTDFNTAQQNSLDALDSLQSYCVNTGVKLGSFGQLVGSQATTFGMFSNEIVGATEHLKNFTEMGSGNLGSFSDQTKTLVDNVSKVSPAGMLASSAVQKLTGMLGSMGVSSNKLSELVGLGGNALANYAKAFLVGADNSLRFQSVLMSGAAQAGNINGLYKGMGETFMGLGDHLENLNGITGNFQAVMSDAMVSTGEESIDTMYKYMAGLIKIPGGLEAVTKGMNIAGVQTNTLTSIMQFAQGAGLDVNATLQDIYKTTSEFGIGIEDSTKFMARMSDVSGDLHAQQRDVHEALFKTTSAFKMYSLNAEDSAKMTQGLADSVKNYARALEAAGVPAQNALDIAGRQITAMEGLSEAQESLIAMDTGMGSGIGGALRFEELMSKDPVAASAKMMESMKKRMGGAQSLVSRSQAAEGDEQVQQQYMLQRQLLTKGTLGVKANSKEEAEAMIEQMIKGEGFGTKTDATKVLAQGMDRGKEKEQLTYTGIKEANITADSVRLQAGTINLGTLQNAFTARTGAMGGIDGTGRGVNTSGQQLLRDTQQKGESSLSGPVGKVFDRLGDTFNNLPSLLRGGATSMTDQITNRGQPEQTAYNPAYKQVGMAVSASKAAVTANPLHSGSVGQGAKDNQPMPVTLVGGSGITVNFTGKCPHCGWDVNTSEQARIQSAPSQASNIG